MKIFRQDGFKKEVNLDPKEIKNMDLAQKQDCMTEVNERRDLAWKFSVFFCIGVMVFIMLYSLLSLAFTLKAHKVPESLNIVVFFVPIVVFIPSFFAHSMDGRCILWTIVTYMLTGFALIITASFLNAWIAPFAFAGAVVYIRVSNVCETYEALSKEDGFPEFSTIESNAEAARAIIERHSYKQEEELDPLTKLAIALAENRKEDAPAGSEEAPDKKAPEEEKAPAVSEEKAPEEEAAPSGPDNKAEEKEALPPEPDEKAEDTFFFSPEEVSESSAQPDDSGSQKGKKHKKKKKRYKNLY